MYSNSYGCLRAKHKINSFIACRKPCTQWMVKISIRICSSIKAPPHCWKSLTYYWFQCHNCTQKDAPRTIIMYYLKMLEVGNVDVAMNYLQFTWIYNQLFLPFLVLFTHIVMVIMRYSVMGCYQILVWDGNLHSLQCWLPLFSVWFQFLQDLQSVYLSDPEISKNQGKTNI